MVLWQLARSVWYATVCDLLHSFHYPAENLGVNQRGVYPFINYLLLKAHAVLVEEHQLHSLAMCFVPSAQKVSKSMYLCNSWFLFDFFLLLLWTYTHSTSNNESKDFLYKLVNWIFVYLMPIIVYLSHLSHKSDCTGH